MENEIPLISIKDMCKVYNPGENEVWALNHVSLEIGRGELVAIIGQSGSGKSTLMNMLGCLDVPTSGTYALNGVNVATLTDNQLSDIRNKEIGFIFQGFNLIPGLNAIENVEVPLFYRGVSKREQRELAVAALTQVGLSHRLDHRPSQMSGGQQQRVGIARALAVNPQIIFADEPTGNLDSKTTMEVLHLMQKIVREQNQTLVMVTHDNNLASYADRRIRIIDGKIVSIEEGAREVEFEPPESKVKAQG